MPSMRSIKIFATFGFLELSRAGIFLHASPSHPFPLHLSSFFFFYNWVFFVYIHLLALRANTHFAARCGMHRHSLRGPDDSASRIGKASLHLLPACYLQEHVFLFLFFYILILPSPGV